MKKDLVMLRGNQAMAEAAYRAGCDFYAGYPITPQSEILEYLSTKMRESGRAFVQAENETSAMSMINGAAITGKRVLTSSAGPGITLKQEGITYAASDNLPVVYIDVARGGNGLATSGSCQSEYKRETTGGGNGDYRVIIYSPGFVQEAVDMVYNAFDVSEKYRNGVGILTESSLGHLVEVVEMPPHIDPKTRTLPEWRKTGERPSVRKEKGREPFILAKSPSKYDKTMLDKEKQAKIIENGQQWESINIEDAEYIIVAFGVPGRMAMNALEKLRAEGEKVGLIRCKTLWPYPAKALEELNPKKVKGLIALETNVTGQMAEDLAVARLKVFKQHYIPVYSITFMKKICPDTKFIIDSYLSVKNGEVKEAF